MRKAKLTVLTAEDLKQVRGGAGTYTAFKKAAKKKATRKKAAKKKATKRK